jgi:WD40 repeat protein
MNSNNGKYRPKLWLIIVAILILIGCCILSLVLAGVLFARDEGLTFQDLLSDPFQREPQIQTTEVIPQVVEEENVPQEQIFEEENTPQENVEETENVPLEQPTQEETLPPLQVDNFLLAITSSGIWKVNETTREALQISTDVIDAPRPYRRGLSPDKKYFAYLTGDLDPTLVLLNLQTNSRVFEKPLTSPNSQIKPDMDASDPGQSVLRAMQTSDSMAWSPDSTHLAFVGAMENTSTDLYFINAADLTISRLSDEDSNAAYIHWSPDGRFIEFVTVNNFGTGAGMNMDAIWVYDRSQGYAKLLEQSTSAGEEFVSWINNESFYIHSWSAICSSHNLRIINAVTGEQDVILESCFSGVAYDPNGKMGIVAVSDMFIDACQCGDVDEFGTYSFGESLGMGDASIKIKKFEYINAYNVELLDPGNLFAIYTDEGLSHLFDETGFPISIPDGVAGVKPFPSPSGDYWAWYPYFGDNTGLWVTDNQMNIFELSGTSTGNMVWRDDGNRLYFIESNQILYADAPDFYPSTFVEILVSQINAIGK